MQQLRSFEQEGSVTKVVLKNGLTILVVEAHSYPLAEVLAWVKVGTMDDPSETKGISRLMEHMLSRGTTNRTASVFATDMKALGGELHSATEYDHTGFWTVVPSAQWQKAVEIQADALLNPLLDPQELKRQIGMMGYESRQEAEDPETLADIKLLATGFAGERMASDRLLPAKTLGAITREKLLAFYQSAYLPSRMLLVVCGDVTAAEVLRTTVDLYAKARGGAAAENRQKTGDPQAGFHYVQVQGRDRLARVLLGFRTVPAGSSDYPALEVLRAMLATGESGILNRRLKYQKGIILGSTAEQASFSDVGYLRFRLDVEPKDLDRCEIAAFIEFEILKHQPLDDSELDRARAQLLREYWEAMQTVSARADRYARFESHGGWRGANDYPARIAQVKWADVARVAARYLNLDNCALLESLPAAAGSRNATAGTVQSTIKDLLASAAAQELAEREKATVLGLDIPAASRKFTPSEVRSTFQTASILRGPDLFIKEDHIMPVIHLGFFFAGGKLAETKTNAGITCLMLRTMLRDSKTRTADQIYRQLEVYGAALTPIVTDDYFGVFFSIPSANVDSGLELLGEMIKSPKLEAEEVERQKRLQSAAFLRESDGALATSRFQEALFGDFSYALRAQGTESTLASITPDSVQAWYRSQVADKKPIVVILGDTQGTNLAGFLVHNFSGSRFEDVKLPEGYVKPLEKRASVDVGWGGNGSTVMIGYQGPPAGDDDSFPLMVLESYASGQGGLLASRVMESMQRVYRVSLSYRSELRGGSVVACLATDPEAEEDALQAMTEEIQRLATGPITYRDYRAAMNSAAAALLIRRQSRFQQIADVVQSVLGGHGLAGYEGFLGRLQDVKQPDLQEIAQRIFKIEKSVTLRLHGKSSP
jgi:zinc protease